MVSLKLKVDLVLDIDINNQVKKFVEKPKGDSAWINGGFLLVKIKF